MGSIWAVARHTFAQCLRMKIAVVFILLLALTLGVLPFSIKGDETLAGQIKTFLSYSTSVTALLVSLVALLLSVSVVTSDVRGKQIFTVATKPVARWQYLMGRWLGVVMLSAVLLAVAGAVIYGVAEHLRGRPPRTRTDRRIVETEIFTARKKVSPEPLDVEAEAAARIAALKAEGGYQQALDSFKARTRGDVELAARALEEEVRSQIRRRRQSCRHGGTLQWAFSNVRAAGQEARGQGEVVATDPGEPRIAVRAGARVMGQLLPGAPVRVEGVEGEVEATWQDSFVVRFQREDMKKPLLRRLSRGAKVHVIVDPTIQVQYKLDPATSNVPDREIYSDWRIENPTTGYGRVYYFRSNPIEIASTLTVSARAAQPGGRVNVTFRNRGSRWGNVQTSVTILHENIAVLFRAGGFGANFVRGMLLILLQAAFLAALGIFASSFLSFPVACLVCFVILTFGMGKSFLTEALTLRDLPGLESDLPTRAGHYALKAMNVILPNFQDTSPADSLAGGMHIAWKFVGLSVAVGIVLRMMLVLGVACLIFRKRELARVQV